MSITNRIRDRRKMDAVRRNGKGSDRMRISDTHSATPRMSFASRIRAIRDASSDKARAAYKKEVKPMVDALNEVLFKLDRLEGYMAKTDDDLYEEYDTIHDAHADLSRVIEELEQSLTW